MNKLLQPIRDYCVELWRAAIDGWNYFWFNPVDPTTLCAIRFLVGFLLLYIHLTTLPALQQFIGPEALVDERATAEIFRAHEDFSDPTERWLHRHFGFSIWHYIQHPAAIWALHGVFLVAVLCLTLGLFSRAANIVAWIGHLSYVNRGFLTWFGMDSVLAMLLLYLMFGPTGATLSLDRWRARSRAQREGQPLPEEPAPSWTANLAIRLIQLHMCVIYLSAGLGKLQGASWWYGTAAWYTMMVPELEVVSMRWLGLLPEWLYHVIVFSATYFTLAFEIGFPFLVWHRPLRPLLVFAGLLLHAGIGFFMGLGGFGLAMIAGLLSFVSPQSLRWFLNTIWEEKPAAKA